MNRFLRWFRLCSVVPLAGTWIEISWVVSHEFPALVVPLAGTWIEITQDGERYVRGKVVPLAGTWIEIGTSPAGPLKSSSFPLRERGLKSRYRRGF